MIYDLLIACLLYCLFIYRVQGRTTRQMKTLLFIAYMVAIIVFVTKLYDGKNCEDEY